MSAMKIRITVPILLAAAALSCQTSGDLQPIVIDFSATKTPAPTPTETPSLPKATPAPAPASPTPEPTATPGPVGPPVSMRPDSSSRSPEEVAQSRIEAYNRHDLEALIGLYAPDARLYEPPDHLRDSGTEQIRQTYARRFASAPHGMITVAKRMTEGNHVVDREIETGAAAQPESALVISEIHDGKITRTWTLK
jgi:hypothetical protein